MGHCFAPRVEPPQRDPGRVRTGLGGELRVEGVGAVPMPCAAGTQWRVSSTRTRTPSSRTSSGFCTTGRHPGHLPSACTGLQPSPSLPGTIPLHPGLGMSSKQRHQGWGKQVVGAQHHLALSPWQADRDPGSGTWVHLEESCLRAPIQGATELWGTAACCGALMVIMAVRGQLDLRWVWTQVRLRHPQGSARQGELCTAQLGHRPPFRLGLDHGL